MIFLFMIFLFEILVLEPMILFGFYQILLCGTIKEKCILRLNCFLKNETIAPKNTKK